MTGMAGNDAVAAEVMRRAFGPAGAAAVTRVEKIVDVGAYHPIVRGGAYYADGILASDYNEKVPELVWDVVRAYAGARFALGVPVVAEGVAVLNPFWAFDGFDAYVPPSVSNVSGAGAAGAAMGHAARDH